MSPAPIDWYRVPLSREQLRSYTEKSSLRGWIQACSVLLLFAATSTSAFLLFRARLWLPMVIVCYFHSFFLHTIGIGGGIHELSHGTVFRGKRTNEFFFHLYCFLAWNNPVHFRASHLLHHQYTLYAGQDKEVVQVPVAQKLGLLSWVSAFTFDYRSFAHMVRVNVLHAVGNANPDFYFWDPLFPEGDPRRKALCRWALFMVLAYVALTVVLAALGLWVLIYVLVLGSFFGTALARVVTVLQHSGLASSVPDWRLVCHTMDLNPVFRFFYWQMSFHTEHHMYAAVPFHALPRFSREAAGRMQAHIPGIRAGVALLRRIRSDQENDPGYVYSPRFPVTADPPRRV
ncbi:MAG TPA: fatty acid desaturase [Spirochaetia bacterium]|nr:fatty acid desaturase [Spirochaetia bacterium]